MKVVLADMHNPMVISMARLKRIGRYLAGRPVLVWQVPLQKLPDKVIYQVGLRLGR